jgi:hypothetical protein
MGTSPSLPFPAAPARTQRLLAGGFFLLLVLFYYWPSLQWLPRGIHEWGQGDRLALAFGFYDHGMNFFKPHTFTLMSIDGVTGVEFPLIPYLAALGAKIGGRSLIVPLYRLLTSLTAWLAYYYLFRLVFERTGQFVAALVPGVFLAASPVFAYYAGNFLPDAAGASLAVVGAYYLLRYPHSQRFRDLSLAIAIYTLATLIKLSAAVYLVAGVGTLLLWGYLQPAAFTLRQRVLLLLLTGASLALIVGYTLYNEYLNQAYNSELFLAAARPLTTMEQFDTLVRRVRESWSYEYFVPFQYPVLLASLAMCVLSWRRIGRTEWLWAAQLGLATVGSLLFLKLLGLQFLHHDYYVLAPFWPGLVLLVALATTQLALRLQRAPRWVPQVLFLALALGILLPGLRRYRERMSEPYQAFSNDYAYHWMMGGAAALAKAGVPPEATILVVGSGAPNLSLVYFDRRGLVWNPDHQSLTPSALLQQMTEVGLDYLLMPRPVFDELRGLHPGLLTTFSEFTATSQFVLLKPPHALPHWR